jgi:hypothetical protein
MSRPSKRTRRDRARETARKSDIAWPTLPPSAVKKFKALLLTKSLRFEDSYFPASALHGHGSPLSIPSQSEPESPESESEPESECSVTTENAESWSRSGLAGWQPC